MYNAEQMLVRCEAVRRHAARNHPAFLGELDRDLSGIEFSVRHGATRAELFEQISDTQLNAHADYDTPRGVFRAAMLSELVGLVMSDEDRAEIAALTERLIADLEAAKVADPDADMWAQFDALLAR